MERTGHFSKKSFPEIVYFNGEWMRHDEARISVFDRGFMHGDGVYEVTPYYSGKPFLLKEHLERLQYSLREIALSFDLSGLEELMHEALEKAGLSDSDAAVYIQVTRGVAPRTHFIPEAADPTFLMYAFPASLMDFEKKSWKVMLHEDLRWQRCDIKSTSWLANTMANSLSHKAGLDETILYRDQKITEGSHSSIFFIKENMIHTHPEGNNILSGITRSFVIDLCKELGYKIKEEPFLVSELQSVENVFCTGTTTQVMEVKEIYSEGRIVFKSTGKGEILRNLQKAFREKTRQN